MFSKISDFDNIISNSINNKIFNNHIECKNVNIFKKRGISLSGSTTLDIYKILKSNSNFDNIRFNSNDLDLYIDLCQLSKSYLEEIFMHLFISGYRIINKKNTKNTKNIQLHKEFQSFSNELLYNLYNCNILRNNNLLENNKYFSLSKYIYKIVNIENKYTNQKIDIIFIKCNIRKLLDKTFDFDIIKNYYSLNSLYIFNKDAIDNNIATMTFNHFKFRVLNNMYELNNFIIRYNKYKERGYKIFINENEIKYNFINKIIKFYFVLHAININEPDYSKNKFYIVNNISDTLYSFYIKYFYINEELMMYIYHPDKINKLLQLNIDIDDI